MDCKFYRGDLTEEERQVLHRLLRKHDSKTIIESWVKLGQTKMPGGRRVDPDKARAVQILRRSKGLCVKEHVDVYAVEQGCVFWRPRP